MRDRSLFAVLLAAWTLAPLAGAFGILGPAPSLFVVPAVGLLAGWHATRLASAALLPVAAMIPLILAYGTVQAIESSLSVSLVERLAVMTAVHAVPVILLAAGSWWLMDRFGLGPQGSPIDGDDGAGLPGPRQAP